MVSGMLWSILHVNHSKKNKNIHIFLNKVRIIILTNKDFTTGLVEIKKILLIMLLIIFFFLCEKGIFYASQILIGHMTWKFSLYESLIFVIYNIEYPVFKYY